MNIADLIAALQRGDDPNQAIPAQFAPGVAGDNPGATAAMNPGIRPEFTGGGFMPPMPPAAPAMAQAPAPPPPPAPPRGVPTPLTNPQPPGSVPTVTQSPPDLANMYLELLKKNQNAQAMDSGMTLIAAGLTPNLATRAALINASSAGGGRGTGVPTAADLVNLQKQHQANKDMMLRRSMVAGLAKQYNLTPQAAMALELDDKLAEVVKHHETQNLTAIEDNATGQKSFYDHRGRKITDIGGPKPRETETRDTFRGPITIYKDTGEPVSGQPIGGEKPVEGTPIKTEQGPTVFVNPRDATQIGAPVGGDKPPPTQVVTGPQGPQVLRTDTGATVGPGVGQPVPDELRSIAMKIDEINRQRAIDNKPPLTMEQYLRTYGKSGVTVNVGPQGQQFPAPPPGQDYKKNADGTVLVDPATNTPELYDLPGGDAQIKREKHAADLAKTKLEAYKLARVEIKAGEGELEKARSKYSNVSSVFAAADTAESIMGNAPWYAPAAGFMSSQFTAAGGTPATNLRAQLETIKGIMSISQLQSMRDASPTGAALGPVSDYENKMLASTVASVDPNQSPELVLRGIRRIKAGMIVIAENNFLKQADGDRAKAQQLYNDAVEREIAGFEKKAGPKNVKGGSVERTK